MKYLYEPLTDKKSGFNHLNRIGLFTEDNDREQIDSLSYVPLEKKVESILKGNPSFVAEDVELDYDEPESDNWDNVEETENDLPVFPIDEYSDKDDVIDIQRKANSTIKVLNDEISKSKVEQTIVDETKDSTKTVTENKETTNEK